MDKLVEGIFFTRECDIAIRAKFIDQGQSESDIQNRSMSAA